MSRALFPRPLTTRLRKRGEPTGEEGREEGGEAGGGRGRGRRGEVERARR